MRSPNNLGNIFGDIKNIKPSDLHSRIAPITYKGTIVKKEPVKTVNKEDDKKDKEKPKVVIVNDFQEDDN